MFACVTGFAEVQFHHGVGLNYLGNFASGTSASAIEAVYHPRITFLHKDNFSIGAGIPLGLGYQFSGDGALMVDVPTMLDPDVWMKGLPLPARASSSATTAPL